MPDPVLNANNPNPTIDRAASTRHHASKEISNSRTAATTSKSQRSSAPSASRDAATRPSSGPPSKETAVVPSWGAPNPTAVARPQPPHQRLPALGANEARVPSYMRELGLRGHPPATLKSTVYVSFTPFR
ncbi:hypothetical protein R3P38DRAFT_3214170 [Favolaschia claudopus]|uniref:Uncharacterized protein n=1 Tax=Favolaschia claudopus TaxID=2862362 RepID=A0AAW0ABA0_9AGAR